jgi:hypothetical protein
VRRLLVNPDGSDHDGRDGHHHKKAKDAVGEAIGAVSQASPELIQALVPPEG